MKRSRKNSDLMSWLEGLWGRGLWVLILCTPLLLFWWIVGTLTLNKIVISLMVPLILLESFWAIRKRIDP